MLKKRVLSCAVLAAVLAALPAAHVSSRSRVKQEKAHESRRGDMAKYGARSDNERIGLSYAGKGEKKLTLDVYWNDHRGLQPIIVNVHGGAWKSGDKSTINDVFRSKYMANRGYVVMNVNYRLLPEHAVEEQIEDVLGAVAWAKNHAENYGGDPSRVGIMGGSAGGHLAAMAAWAGDDESFEPTGHSRADVSIQAAVIFYGIYDPWSSLDRIMGGGKIENAKEFTGEDNPVAAMLAIRRLSPDNHIDRDIPPTLLVVGDLDAMNLYRETKNVKKKLDAAGATSELYRVYGEGHGFDKDYGNPETIKAMEAVKKWFDNHLK